MSIAPARGYTSSFRNVVAWYMDGDYVYPLVEDEGRLRLISSSDKAHLREVPVSLSPANPGTVAEWDEKDGSVSRSIVHAWGLLPSGDSVPMVFMDGSLEPAMHGNGAVGEPDRITPEA